MILEQFSEFLHGQDPHGKQPVAVLERWLLHQLARHPKPGDPVAQVVHHELQVNPKKALGNITLTHIEPRTASGEQLLQQLVDYCKSYQRWRFARWLHRLKASDFRKLGNA